MGGIASKCCCKNSSSIDNKTELTEETSYQNKYNLSNNSHVSPYFKNSALDSENITNV